MGAQGLEGWAGVPRAPELFLVLPSMPLRGAVCLPGPGTHMPLGPKPASQVKPSPAGWRPLCTRPGRSCPAPRGQIPLASWSSHPAPGSHGAVSQPGCSASTGPTSRCCFPLPSPLRSPLGPRLSITGIPQAWASLPGVSGTLDSLLPLGHFITAHGANDLRPSCGQVSFRMWCDTAHPPSPNQDPNSLCHRPGARHTDVAPSLAYDSVFHLQDFAQRVPSTSEVPLLLLCPQDTPAYVTARGVGKLPPMGHTSYCMAELRIVFTFLNA